MRRAWLVTILSLLCMAAPAQEIRAPYRALADSVTRLMGFAPVGGNAVRSYRSGEAFLAALLEDIDAAKETIDLEYYWLSGDDVGRPVRDALARKAREGLRVRVIVDNLIVPLLPEYYFKSLEESGARMRFRTNFEKVRLWELPGIIVGQRDHRKIVVLDGRVCYTGGMNLCRHTLQWDDTHMRIEGPLAVPMTALFEQSWEYVSGDPPGALPAPVIPADGSVVAQLVHGDGTSTALEDVYIQVLKSVRHYIYLFTPYLVPPPRLIEALQETAARGVDVRIILQLESDWPFMNHITEYYQGILDGLGIRFYIYGVNYDHSKCFVADDYLSACGTVNLDNRSFHTNCENTVFYYDETVARESLADFRRIMDASTEAFPDPHRQTGLWKTWINFLLSISEIL